MCWPAKATRPCAASRADPDGRPGQRLGGSGLAGGRLSAAAPTGRPRARKQGRGQVGRLAQCIAPVARPARMCCNPSIPAPGRRPHIPISAHEAYGQRATASRHHPVRHGTHHHGRRAAAHRDVQLRGGARFFCKADCAIGASLDILIPARFRDIHARHVDRFRETGVSERKMGLGSPLWACAPTGKNFPWKRRSRRRTARRACSSPSSCATSLNASGFPRRCWPRATS